LEVECRIDTAARLALVPGIMIQPLVENALKYGKKTSPRPLRIRVVVSSLPSGGVKIEVSNTGTRVEPNHSEPVGGVGLENLKSRLKLIYPDSHDLRISEADGWVTVTIQIDSPS